MKILIVISLILLALITLVILLYVFLPNVFNSIVSIFGYIFGCLISMIFFFLIALSPIANKAQQQDVTKRDKESR
jgi:hypothetical protein